MAKQCCRPTTSGDDLDPGGAGTIRHFKARVADLEAANAAKDVALRAWVNAEDALKKACPACDLGESGQDCCCRERIVERSRAEGGLRAALSDAGKGWLSPEVGKQVRIFLLRHGVCKAHAVVGRGECSDRCIEARVALAALEVT